MPDTTIMTSHLPRYPRSRADDSLGSVIAVRLILAIFGLHASSTADRVSSAAIRGGYRPGVRQTGLCRTHS